MNYENVQQKIDVLKTVYGAMHEHIRANEAFENRVAFSVGTLFMLFTAFVLRENIHPNFIGKMVIASMILAIVIATIMFIKNNNDRIKYQCRIVVNIEKAFGFYNNNCFDIGNMTQLLPEDAKEWGIKQKRLFLFPHVLGVVFSGVSAIVSLFIDLPR
jgi:hypothetical protein